MLGVTDMLAIADQIHFVLVKTDPNSEMQLISSTYLDWRSVLCSPTGKKTISIEMLGVGSLIILSGCLHYICSFTNQQVTLFSGTESSIPVGIIEMTLSVIPAPDVLAEDVLEQQINLEKGYQSERNRLFLVYTKQWWREFLELRTSHSKRLVKLYAQVILVSLAFKSLACFCMVHLYFM